jgi:hypothetical protein
VKWLYWKIVRQAQRGRFCPAISAWGNTGVWVWRGDEVEFQWDEVDGDAVWKVCGRTVAYFREGRLIE